MTATALVMSQLGRGSLELAPLRATPFLVVPLYQGMYVTSTLWFAGQRPPGVQQA